VKVPPDSAGIEHGRTADAPAKGKVRLLSLDELDGRTRAYRDVVSIRDQVLADLGGADRLSTLERLAAENVAMSAAMLRDMGARWLRGEEVDPGALATLQNTFNRTAAALGWQRRARDISPPDPLLYAKARAAEAGR
jgi:hypothetical protein